MNAKHYVGRSSEIAARRMGDEMMIMSGRDSTLFTLNEVATVIWEAADGATTLGEIVEHQVCARFDIAGELALRDAQLLTEALAAHGILLTSDKPLPATSGAGPQ